MIIEYDLYRQYYKIPHLEEVFVEKQDNKTDSAFVVVDKLNNIVALFGVTDHEGWLDIVDKHSFTTKYILQIRKFIKKVFKLRYDKIKVDYDNQLNKRLGDILWQM